jgi:hypothetical protein
LDGDENAMFARGAVEREPDADVAAAELVRWPRCQEDTETRAALAAAEPCCDRPGRAGRIIRSAGANLRPPAT